jgi:hypothetical protein
MFLVYCCYWPQISEAAIGEYASRMSRHGMNTEFWWKQLVGNSHCEGNEGTESNITMNRVVIEAMITV